MPIERKARILVVGDDEGVRCMLGRALVEDGYEVVAVDDRREAVAGMAPARFDLFITNVRMPGLTGDQMAAELGRRFPGLPILHLEDLSHPLGAELPPEVSALAKPFTLEGLLAAVAHVLKHCPRRSARPESTGITPCTAPKVVAHCSRPLRGEGQRWARHGLPEARCRHEVAPLFRWSSRSSPVLRSVPFDEVIP